MAMEPPRRPTYSLRVKLFSPTAAGKNDEPVRCFRVPAAPGDTVREFCREVSAAYSSNYGGSLEIKKCQDDDLFDISQNDKLGSLFGDASTIRIIQAPLASIGVRDSLPPSSHIRYSLAGDSNGKRRYEESTQGNGVPIDRPSLKKQRINSDWAPDVPMSSLEEASEVESLTKGLKHKSTGSVIPNSSQDTRVRMKQSRTRQDSQLDAPSIPETPQIDRVEKKPDRNTQKPRAINGHSKPSPILGSDDGSLQARSSCIPDLLSRYEPSQNWETSDFDPLSLAPLPKSIDRPPSLHPTLDSRKRRERSTESSQLVSRESTSENKESGSERPLNSASEAPRVKLRSRSSKSSGLSGLERSKAISSTPRALIRTPSLHDPKELPLTPNSKKRQEKQDIWEVHDSEDEREAAAVAIALAAKNTNKAEELRLQAEVENERKDKERRAATIAQAKAKETEADNSNAIGSQIEEISSTEELEAGAGVNGIARERGTGSQTQSPESKLDEKSERAVERQRRGEKSRLEREAAKKDSQKRKREKQLGEDEAHKKNDLQPSELTPRPTGQESKTGKSESIFKKGSSGDSTRKFRREQKETPEKDDIARQNKVKTTVPTTRSVAMVEVRSSKGSPTGEKPASSISNSKTKLAHSESSKQFEPLQTPLKSPPPAHTQKTRSSTSFIPSGKRSSLKPSLPSSQAVERTSPAISIGTSRDSPAGVGIEDQMPLPRTNSTRRVSFQEPSFEIGTPNLLTHNTGENSLNETPKLSIEAPVKQSNTPVPLPQTVKRPNKELEEAVTPKLKASIKTNNSSSVNERKAKAPSIKTPVVISSKYNEYSTPYPRDLDSGLESERSGKDTTKSLVNEKESTTVETSKMEGQKNDDDEDDDADADVETASSSSSRRESRSPVIFTKHPTSHPPTQAPKIKELQMKASAPSISSMEGSEELGDEEEAEEAEEEEEDEAERKKENESNAKLAKPASTSQRPIKTNQPSRISTTPILPPKPKDYSNGTSSGKPTPTFKVGASLIGLASSGSTFETNNNKFRVIKPLTTLGIHSALKELSDEEQSEDESDDEISDKEDGEGKTAHLRTNGVAPAAALQPSNKLDSSESGSDSSDYDSADDGGEDAAKQDLEAKIARVASSSQVSAAIPTPSRAQPRNR